MAAEQYPPLDARSVAIAMWRRAWMIVAIVAAAFVLTYALSKLQSPVYVSFADVHVNSSNPNLKVAGTDPLGGEEYFIGTASVRTPAFNAIGPAEAEKVLGVSVSKIANTTVLRIAVRSHSPTAARDAANAMASSYVTVRQAQLGTPAAKQVASLQKQIAAGNANIIRLTQQSDATPGAGGAAIRTELAQAKSAVTALNSQLTAANTQLVSSGGAVSVVKTAGLPSIPVSPTPLRDAGLAALVALVIAIGLALLLEQINTKIKGPDQVAKATGGLSVLASIPEYGTGPHRFSRRFHRAERALVSPTSAAAESYHALATNLRFSNMGKEKRTILVTSSSGEEGKTTVTANLAAVLAENGLRVVVVSADLRRPMLGELLHSVETEKGLTSAMLGDRELASCFVSVPLPSGKNIFVLPAGPLPHDPAVLLGSDAFGQVLDQIKRSQADFILIDCAPVLPVSDPVAASRHVDGVLVLALQGETREQDLAETVDRLRQVDADIIGVVLNGVPVTRGRFNYYGYYSYQSYQPYRAEPPPPPPTNGNGGATNGRSTSTNGADSHPAPAEAASVDQSGSGSNAPD